MKTTEREEIEHALAKFKNFDQCIIESVAFLYFGTAISITLNYIWSASGHEVRKDFDVRPEYITLIFTLVEEFSISNHLTPAMLARPNELGWGIAEVSSVRLASPRELNSDEVGFHRIIFRNEKNVRMSVLFKSLEVLNGSQPCDWKDRTIT